MVSTTDGNYFLEQYGGTDFNNLINTLRIHDDNNEIATLKYSPYMDLNTIKKQLHENKNLFTVFSLNAQCINAKFAEIHVLIDDLIAENCTFGAICIQETWLNDNDDVTMYNLPGYNMINQGKVCCGHGGLIIYLNDTYTHTVRKYLYKDSTLWEGLFIDISGETIFQKNTLGNIYKPPKNNNNNPNITSFINAFSPLLHTLSHENSYSILAGDFNMDLLKLNERELFTDFFDNMCSSGFLPHVTVPTRFATYSCSLLDQIYIKTPRGHEDIHNIKTSSGVMISNISDHLPCFTSICIIQIKTTKHSTFITLNNLNETAISKFKDGLATSRLQAMLNHDLNVNPNLTYNIIDKQIADAREKFLPVKTVRFNKHKHTKNHG